jgi:hypothetical protein
MLGTCAIREALVKIATFIRMFVCVRVRVCALACSNSIITERVLISSYRLEQSVGV